MIGIAKPSAHQGERHDRGRPECRREDRHPDSAGCRDRQQLAGAEREVGTLDQPLEALELLDVGEHVLDPVHETRAGSGTRLLTPGLAALDLTA